MKRIGVILFGFALFCPAVHASKTPFKIVVDPGHGGADEGTVYDDGRTRVAEKDVTLLLARQVVRQLKNRGYKVYMTRNTDREVPLPARTALANRLGADVFLSIHMNSTPTPMVNDAQGIETYILNSTSDASSRRLAHLENSVTGASATDSPEGMDVALILKDLRLDANVTESKRLACSIQGNMVSASTDAGHSRRNRGVKQALFHVLLGADMPSVLLEAGFLTSSKDRNVVLSVRGQHAISGAITRALDQFRKLKGTRQAIAALSSCKVN